MKSKILTVTFAAHALTLAAATGAFAQDSAPAGEPGPGGTTVIQLPPAPAGPTYDPDAHLGAGSRGVTDVSRSTDGFDFKSGSGAASVRGGTNSSYVVEGQYTPEAHTVRRGDTLWELSARYYQNSYAWPRVWAFNPQIQNPHWIYPGDRVRLREEGAAPTRAAIGFKQNKTTLHPQTIFLRDIGWVDDKVEDTWGEIVGSPEDHMMLNEGDDLYVQLDEGHEMHVGDQMTIFRPIRTVENKNAKGQLVSIRGTAKIDRYNPKTRMARAKITEMIDVIERGAKIGPVGRRFDVVAPVPSEQDIDAGILAAVYPYQIFSQHQVVFLDRGGKDGVKVGQRFFAIHRGDIWAQNVKGAGELTVKRARVEDDERAEIDSMRVGVDEDLLPDETYAELRVIRVRENTSTAVVVASKRELERNARLIARKGL